MVQLLYYYYYYYYYYYCTQNTTTRCTDEATVYLWLQYTPISPT